jgi:DNA polymerase III alpha subunit
MKWHSINFLCIIILVLTVVLCGNFSDAAQETTVEKTLANKDSFDGKEVSVSGTVSKLKLKTSKGGNEYTTFSLINGSGVSLNVFVWGHSKIKEGQKVKVIGTYRKDKKVGRYTFYNEIEATEVKNE